VQDVVVCDAVDAVEVVPWLVVALVVATAVVEVVGGATVLDAVEACDVDETAVVEVDG
jgi:hypothetical protein